jgi:hypothetical protein
MRAFQSLAFYVSTVLLDTIPRKHPAFPPMFILYLLQFCVFMIVVWTGVRDAWKAVKNERQDNLASNP